MATDYTTKRFPTVNNPEGFKIFGTDAGGSNKNLDADVLATKTGLSTAINELAGIVETELGDYSKKKDVANNFNSSATYSVGDYFYKDGILYRVTKWDEENEEYEYTSVKVTSEIKQKSSKTELEEGLDGKADSVHTHSVSEVSGLYEDLQELSDSIDTKASSSSVASLSGRVDSVESNVSKKTFFAYYNYPLVTSNTTYAGIKTAYENTQYGCVLSLITYDSEFGIVTLRELSVNGSGSDDPYYVFSGTANGKSYQFKVDASDTWTSNVFQVADKSSLDSKIGDAPSDNYTYARKNGAWEKLQQSDENAVFHVFDGVTKYGELRSAYSSGKLLVLKNGTVEYVISSTGPSRYVFVSSYVYGNKTADFSYFGNDNDVIHVEFEVNDYASESELEGKADSVHTHEIADVNGLADAIEPEVFVVTSTTTNKQVKDAYSSGKRLFLKKFAQGGTYEYECTGVATGYVLHFSLLASNAFDYAVIEVGGKEDDAAVEITYSSKSILNDANADGKQYARKDNAWVEVDTSTTWDDVSGKPSTFAPSEHTHEIADVSGLEAALEDKANSADIPTKTSELTNDSNFIAGTSITSVVASTEEPAEGTPTTTMTIVYEA